MPKIINLSDRNIISIDDFNLHPESQSLNFEEVEELDLSMNPLKDAAIVERFPNLRRLYLCETYIADISSLPNLKKLEALHLNGTLVTDLSPLARNTALKILILTEVPAKNISVLSQLSNLEELSLCGMSIEGGDLSPIKKLFALRKLLVNGTNIHLQALWDLVDLIHLEELTISGDEAFILTKEAVMKKIKENLKKSQSSASKKLLDAQEEEYAESLSNLDERAVVQKISLSP